MRDSGAAPSEVPNEGIEQETLLFPWATAYFDQRKKSQSKRKQRGRIDGQVIVTSWDYSTLSAEALALDASGAICTGGVNEWGSPNTVVTTSAEELLQVATVLNLSVAPQMIAELKLGIAQKDECETQWAIIALIHLFQFQTVKNSAEYSSIPAADFNVFPEFTECRPDVQNDKIIGSKLVLSTNGEDLLAVVPDLMKQFPYGFTSSLPAVSRVMVAHNTKHPASTVIQALCRAYYAGCRVREVNSTGVYIEDLQSNQTLGDVRTHDPVA